jgi:hypothetical protein
MRGISGADNGVAGTVGRKYLNFHAAALNLEDYGEELAVSALV